MTSDKWQGTNDIFFLFFWTQMSAIVIIHSSMSIPINENSLSSPSWVSIIILCSVSHYPTLHFIASQPVPEIWNLPLSSSLTLRYRIVSFHWIVHARQCTVSGCFAISPSHHLTYVMPHSCQRHHGLHCVVTSSRRHASYYLVCIQRDGWVM